CFYVFFGALVASREHHWPLLNYFQAMFMHWMVLAIIIAFTLLGSLVFAAPSSNSTICFVVAGGILVIGKHLNGVALSLPEPGRSVVYALYYLIPHLEFFDLRNLVVHDWPLIDWPFISLAVLYAAAYTAVF